MRMFKENEYRRKLSDLMAELVKQVMFYYLLTGGRGKHYLSKTVKSKSSLLYFTHLIINREVKYLYGGKKAYYFCLK